MAGPVTVTVTGADTVARTMQQAARDLADLSSSNQRTGDIIAAGARMLAPRLTGALAGATRGASTKDTAGIENAEPYFGPIHYGWPARNIRAQPFVDTALVQTQPQWMAVYVKAVKAATDQVRGV